MNHREARRFISVHREGLTKEVALKDETGGGRRGDLGGSRSGRRNSIGKGSEVGASTACLKTRKEVPGWSVHHNVQGKDSRSTQRGRQEGVT